MARTWALFMRPRRSWWIARAAARVPGSCCSTPTVTAAITSETFRANTIGRSRKSSDGSRSGIRLPCTPRAWWRRAWPTAPYSTGSNPRSPLKWTRPSSLRSMPPIRIRERSTRTSMPETATKVREIGFGDAIREALAEEMRRDSRIVLLGEDVAEAGTPFKVVKGLVEEFGTQRIIDTPISEAGFTGLAVGAAMTGVRPVVDIMFGDFLALVMDQVVNQAAKVHYMSGGKWKVPLVIRATMG